MPVRYICPQCSERQFPTQCGIDEHEVFRKHAALLFYHTNERRHVYWMILSGSKASSRGISFIFHWIMCTGRSWPHDTMITLALQIQTNGVGAVIECISVHEHNVFANMSTEKANMRQQNVSNVLCSGHGNCFKHVQWAVVLDHESCPYHDAASTISVPLLDNFWDINTAHFTPYQYPSTISRKIKLALICEEGIDPVVLGHTQQVFELIVLSFPNDLQQFSRISEFLQLHRIDLSIVQLYCTGYFLLLERCTHRLWPSYYQDDLLVSV